MPTHLLRRIVPLAAALVLLAAPLAQADGDPASDVLLSSSTFYPAQPPVSAKLQSALDSLTRKAGAARFPIRVAIVGSVADLGSNPVFFGHPQPYARFLFNEIRLYRFNGPLLVVMPAGFGLIDQRGQLAATGALDEINLGAGKSEALTKAAIVATLKLAKNAGHQLPRPPGVDLSSARAAGSSGGALVAAIVGLGTLLLAALAVVLRRRAGDATSQGS